MGATGGMSREVILAEAKRQVRDLEGRMEVTRGSIDILEKAIEPAALDSRQERIERMLEAVINTQLVTLRGHLEEGTTKLTEMKASVEKAESPIRPALTLPSNLPHRPR